MSSSTPASSSSSSSLTAFINFPSPYTQSLILNALTSLISTNLSISVLPPNITSGDDLPSLQWADYDLMTLDDERVYNHPSLEVLQSRSRTGKEGGDKEKEERHLISSYIYRKTLIRKHMLHSALQEYMAKLEHRSSTSTYNLTGTTTGTKRNSDPAASLVILKESIPRGWTLDIQFADELDEMLMDDLYDLREELDQNEAAAEAEESESEPRDRKWFILKPGMSDKAQGIRMFSTVEQLEEIFQSFEPESSDEEDDDDDDDDDDDEEEEEEEEERESHDKAGRRNVMGGRDLSKEDLERIEKLAVSDFPDDEPYEESNPEEEEEEDDDNEGTGVRLSQLRHFVIQEYVPRPMLFDPLESTRPSDHPLQGHKFHLRAYVLLTGTYKLYLSRTLLALFSSEAFSMPGSSITSDSDFSVVDGDGLTPHLTNTCLQASAVDPSISLDDYVKLFWEIEGMNLLAMGTSSSRQGFESKGKITKEWLEGTFEKVGKVIAETVQGAVECGSFGMQLLENAFELFGVDLLLSFPQSTSTDSSLPLPTVTLLEFNASPDFTQSGDRLSPELGEMFKDVVEVVIKPFFEISSESEGEGEGEGESEAEVVVGDDGGKEIETKKGRGNLVLIGEKQSRGQW